MQGRLKSAFRYSDRLLGEAFRLDALPAFFLWQLDIFCQQRVNAVDFFSDAQRHAPHGKESLMKASVSLRWLELAVAIFRLNACI